MQTWHDPILVGFFHFLEGMGIGTDSFVVRFFRGDFVPETISMACILVVLKWNFIHYGMPYMTHVDESMIATDPLKIILRYSAGDFSISTNLYNWMLLVWTGCVFVAGLVSGRWSGFDEFRTVLVAAPEDVVFWGRLLSLILTVAASVILIRLVCTLTSNNPMRWLLSLLILCNPLELNAVNWVKFDSAAYLMYAILISLGYRYFIRGEERLRWWMYLALYSGVSVRIEMVVYLGGFLLADVIRYYRTGFVSLIQRLALPQVAGLAIYLVVTLMPLTFLYRPSANDAVLTTSPTFQQAIWEKLPSWQHLKAVLSSSDYYLYCVLLFQGPLLLYFLRKTVGDRIWYILIPFVLNVIAICVFPVRLVHYLLSVSVLIIAGALFFLSHGVNRTKIIFASVALVWSGSFFVYESYLLIAYGDVRLVARDYLLDHTGPDETIYIDGIFANVHDKRSRYALRAKASKVSGSTGLSNAYFAEHLDDRETRVITQVSNWEPFEGTPYARVFNNLYDTAMLRRDNPTYYVYVVPTAWPRLDAMAHSERGDFYTAVLRGYHLEKEFDYPFPASKLIYTNRYYFHRVSVYRANSSL